MTGFLPDQDGAEVRVSANFGARRRGGPPDMILLHYTGMATAEAAEARLCDPDSQVSAHYVVREDGRIVQLVRESDRAWHAGQSFWQGETDINSCSIGIEVANPGHLFGYPDFPDPQVDAVIALCRGVAGRHAVAPERVLAHSDVAPDRKIDPGEKFPWARLARAGIGHFVKPTPHRDGPRLAPGERGAEVEALQSMLALYGYGVEASGVFDAQTRIVVEAFQRHFRPALVDGLADPSTVETLRALLESVPKAPPKGSGARRLT